MSSFPFNHLPPQSGSPMSDPHHDILSMGSTPMSTTEHRLLSHLTSPAQPMDPLAALLAAEPLSADTLLQNIMLEPQDAPAPRISTLGPEAPLSQCMLWQMQEDYYKNMGINAWESNVPCYITSSAAIAEAYAEMIVAFLLDCREQLQTDEPVYVVEMATGTGRFSHLCLQELTRKLSRFSRLKDVQLRYVMTDFTDANPEFWAQHEKLQPFIQSGMLDFAVFNPLCEQHMTLRLSGQTLAPKTLTNPMIAIANYFFDSIRQDIFRVESKRLHEGLVTLERRIDADIDPASAPHISQITPHFRYREMRHDQYYADPKLNAVLRHYKHQVRQGTFLFPIGAFEVVRNLQALSNHNLMLLSSDKAYTQAAPMMQFDEHHFAPHGGAFSYMVNYDALGQYFRNEGGQYFHTTAGNLSLQTVCLVDMAASENHLVLDQLNYVYQERIDRQHPITTTCSLLPDERELNDMAQMDRFLSYIRLNLADPKIITVLAQRIIDVLPQASQPQKDDLMMLMDQAWANYYHFPGEANLPFWLSQLYFYLNRFEDSLRCLELTVQYFGLHEALLFLKGNAYEQLGQLAQAKAMYAEAVAMFPEFTEAQQALEAIEARM